VKKDSSHECSEDWSSMRIEERLGSKKKESERGGRLYPNPSIYTLSIKEGEEKGEKSSEEKKKGGEKEREESASVINFLSNRDGRKK